MIGEMRRISADYRERCRADLEVPEWAAEGYILTERLSALSLQHRHLTVDPGHGHRTWTQPSTPSQTLGLDGVPGAVEATTRRRSEGTPTATYGQASAQRRG